MHNFNIQLFHVINNLAGHSLGLDEAMVFITTYLTYIVCSAALLYVVVLIPLRAKAPLARLGAVAAAAEMTLALFFTWLITAIIKVVVAYPRPFETLQHIEVLVRIAGGDSFPSAHAALSAACATIVHFHHRRLGMLLFVFAAVVGLSRIYVGVHYPLDVAVGFLLGYGIPTLLHKAFAKK